MIAAPSARVLPVNHELLRTETALPRESVKAGRIADQFVPGSGRLDVHFDNAWIGGNFENANAGVGGWRVPFDHDGNSKMRGCVFDGGYQVQIIRQMLDRRHEHK